MNPETRPMKIETDPEVTATFNTASRRRVTGSLDADNSQNRDKVASADNLFRGA